MSLGICLCVSIVYHLCYVYYLVSLFFFTDTTTTEIYPLSLHDALPILLEWRRGHAEPLVALPVLVAQIAGLIEEAEIRTFDVEDRKSTRLNSSHGSISYAVFCLKKKKRIEVT